jgi:hypothetical protein
VHIPYCAALSARRNPLPSLAGLGCLASLERVDVSNCPGLCSGDGEGLGLHDCTGLRELDIGGCCRLCSLVGLPLGLEGLVAKGCGLTDLEPLAGCASLARLDVSANLGLTSLRGMHGCTSLKVSGGGMGGHGTDPGAWGSPGGGMGRGMHGGTNLRVEEI